jgi:hypothetical protein
LWDRPSEKAISKGGVAMKRAQFVFLIGILLVTFCVCGKVKDGAQVYNERGVTHYDKGEYDLAIANFSKALQLMTEPLG